MTYRDVITPDVACCVPSDSVARIAEVMKNQAL